MGDLNSYMSIVIAGAVGLGGGVGGGPTIFKSISITGAGFIIIVNAIKWLIIIVNVIKWLTIIGMLMPWFVVWDPIQS